jgi:putative transposase
LIEQANLKIPIKRQCELLGISRSGFYYQSKGISPYNLHLMKLIDEQYLRTPFYGANKITVWLRLHGHKVNVKRIRRLMRIMGIEAVYPKRNLSLANKEHRKYPYLLRDVVVDRPDQVWCTDITYIRLMHGFVYLTAIMDWHSRYVLSWELSNTLDAGFCLIALERAMKLSHPDILNTDQGVQFTSSDFIEAAMTAGIKISMDGRGRAFDNIFIERLWRTLKYEEIYLKNYETVKEASAAISAYFHFYNTERLHQSLNYKTPAEIYFKRNDLQNIKIFRQANEIIHLNLPKLLS